MGAVYHLLGISLKPDSSDNDVVIYTFTKPPDKPSRMILSELYGNVVHISSSLYKEILPQTVL